MYTTTDNIRVDMLLGLLRRNQILSAREMLYNDKDFKHYENLFKTFELNEQVVYKGQIGRIIGIKDQQCHINLNGKIVKLSPLFLQKINY